MLEPCLSYKDKDKASHSGKNHIGKDIAADYSEGTNKECSNNTCYEYDQHSAIVIWIIIFC